MENRIEKNGYKNKSKYMFTCNFAANFDLGQAFLCALFYDFFCYQAEERLYTVFMYVSYTRHTTQSKMREMAKNNAPKIIFLFHENTISRGALRNVETSIAHNTR